MNRPALAMALLMTACVGFSFMGCAGGDRGILKRVETPTESELRRDWQEYRVYYRRSLALVFKIKDNRQIILNNSWTEISSAEALANSRIMDSSWVNEIIGSNGTIFGYLVRRNHDTANVKIIDPDTVQLYYHYVRNSGGP